MKTTQTTLTELYSWGDNLKADVNTDVVTTLKRNPTPAGQISDGFIITIFASLGGANAATLSQDESAAFRRAFPSELAQRGDRVILTFADVSYIARRAIGKEFLSVDSYDRTNEQYNILLELGFYTVTDGQWRESAEAHDIIEDMARPLGC